MSGRLWIVCGSAMAALAVLAGAFGAHGLKQHVAEGRITPDQFEAYRTAAQYHMLHAIGMVLVGLVARGTAPLRMLNFAGAAFLLGMILFSGSIYADVLASTHLPWPLVPSGGLLFVAGWLLLAIAGWCGSNTAR